MKKKHELVLIGYSGHAFVLYDIFVKSGYEIIGYCENEHKIFNPFNLVYYGSETSENGLSKLRRNNYFIAIGNNNIRKKIQLALNANDIQPSVNAIDETAIIGTNVQIGNGVMIAQNVVINAQATIADGVICNTSSVIEHEVEVKAYSFIAPNATLLGGVKIGENCFIGANAVVLQNVSIGDNCIIGAGSVILKDIPPNSKVVGNPSRFI